MCSNCNRNVCGGRGAIAYQNLNNGCGCDQANNDQGCGCDNANAFNDGCTSRGIIDSLAKGFACTANRIVRGLDRSLSCGRNNNGCGC